jgi:hypothetical protein
MRWKNNIQPLNAVDLNAKLRERGCANNITVQRICKAARNEDEVRQILDKVWEGKDKSEGFLTEVLVKNKDLFEFEKMLDQKT